MSSAAPESPLTDRRLAFNRDPESYDRGRPSYPPQAYDDLFAFVGAAAPSVLEVGPGTGQATRDLLGRAGELTAVEFGPQLAERLQQNFQGDARLNVINGSFETVDLPVGTFDLVFAATAWKWLDSGTRLNRVIDLLRPGGVVATLATIQIASDVDQRFFEVTLPIYRKYRPNERLDDLQTETEATPPEYEEFEVSDQLTDLTIERYRWDQTYTPQSYELLLRSYSDMQSMSDRARDSLIRDLCDTIDRDFGGSITRPLVIALTMARKGQ